MAEKIQDAEDRILQSMFDSESIVDDGFSDRVLRRVRRQIWIRRLALPIAMIIGAAIAVKPTMQLIAAGSRIFGSLPTESLLPTSVLSTQLPVLIVVGIGLAGAVLMFRLFEE